MNDDTLGSQLRTARKRAKLTQAQLAAKLGISQEMVSMMEDGRKPVPATLRRAIERYVGSGRLPTSDELLARSTGRETAK